MRRVGRKLSRYSAWHRHWYRPAMQGVQLQALVLVFSKEDLLNYISGVYLLLVGVFSCTVLLVGVFSCMASASVSPSHDRMVVTSPRRGSALPQHSHKSTIWLLSSASIHIHLILQLSNTSIHIHHIQQLYDFYHLFPFILKMAI